jgi:hypothetical protein
MEGRRLSPPRRETSRGGGPHEATLGAPTRVQGRKE